MAKDNLISIKKQLTTSLGNVLSYWKVIMTGDGSRLKQEINEKGIGGHGFLPHAKGLFIFTTYYLLVEKYLIAVGIY